jgi:hypothetical protein
MKTLKIGLVTLVALAVLGAIGLGGDTPATARSLSAAQLAQIHARSEGKAGDPLLTGSATLPAIPGNSLEYVDLLSSEFTLPRRCAGLAIDHADGNIFNTNATTGLSLNGADVAILFLSGADTVLGELFLASAPVTGLLGPGGITTNSPQPVFVPASDLPAGTASVEFIVEGNVTNSTTTSQTVAASVDGLVSCF